MLLSVWICTLPALAQTSLLDLSAYSEEKHKTCIACHLSDDIRKIARTKHADRSNPDSPAAREECESCHLPSAAHSSFPMQIKSFNFGSNSHSSNKIQNEVCLDCHIEGRDPRWYGSMHAQSELGCADCHTIHKKNDPLLDHTLSPKICISCHEQIQESQQVAGLHIIETGKVACVDCHNPHTNLNATGCGNCHPLDPKTLATQTPKAQGFHTTAVKNNLSCLRCHQHFAHDLPGSVLEHDPDRQQQFIQTSQ
jgi:predicted CXXCH cytochrome family protein